MVIIIQIGTVYSLTISIANIDIRLLVFRYSRKQFFCSAKYLKSKHSLFVIQSHISFFFQSPCVFADKNLCIFMKLSVLIA